MANRHLARSVVLQSLFEWDFGGKPNKKKEAMLIFRRNVQEFAPGIKDVSFMESLMESVLAKSKDLDTIISTAAPDWPLEKIAVVDRNVLRIGLYELLFADRSEVPPKVAINEAIELAKTFGGETSGKFVNGVLGAVYKEMGEPGRDERSSKKKNANDIPDDQAPVENLGGAVVYAEEGKKIFVALVHDVFGHWTLSKGKLEAGEDVEAGTVREVKEEIGLDVTPEDDLGVNEYIAFPPDKGKIKKRVHYFLARSDFQPLQLESQGGLDNARWFALDEVAELNFYDDIVPLITKAIQILGRKSSRAKRKNE